MKDIYLMNRETGEILPSTDAIRDFYKTHGILESWCDLWIETKIETATEIDFPDFRKVMR